MPIPTDYIFQSGSCQKKELYKLIIDKLTAAGWTDVSSNPTTDFVVLTSKGNAGGRDLILNLRPVPAAGTAANNVMTSNYSSMSYRLQTSYTPGAAGVAGVFGRATQAWINLTLVPVAITVQTPADTVVSYKVYADASKIILAIEYPSALGLSPQLFYLGQPDTVFLPETDSAGCLYGTTSLATTAASVMVCNSPDTIGNVADQYALGTQSLIPAKSPNNAGKYFASEIYYGSATEGIRGKLDGVLCVLNTNLLTGDNIIIDGKTYYVLCCAANANNSFPSYALLIRTA